jgi:aspartate-semialdehyde dehydrogenase
VIGGHSESVNVEFYNEFDIDDVVDILNEFPGVAVKNSACPAEVQNETDVWVSRIRRDFTQQKSLNLWIVADNLMKGSALNAVQIAEQMATNEWF